MAFIFLTLWLGASASVGYLINRGLKYRLEVETETAAAQTLSHFHHFYRALKLKSKSLEYDQQLPTMLASDDLNQLLKTLLPIQVGLGVELLKVVNRDGEVVINLDQRHLANIMAEDQEMITVAQHGLALSSVVTTNGDRHVLFVEVAPIKSENQVMGGPSLASS